VNADVGLLARTLRSTVHIRARIPREHASAQILGTERMGSGLVVDGGGLLLTVNYVVLGAEEVKVVTLDDRAYVAEVVRQDFHSGLALLRVAGRDLPPLPLRRTADLELGEGVFIVASVGEGSARVADGAISYLGPFDANWEYVLEHAIMSTAMNPGLGGGPLVDARGRVVGVASLNLNDIGRFSLSIPADYYLDARDAFVSGNRPAGDARAWLGIFCHAMNDRVVIAGMLNDGPGERAGLKPGDVVVAVDGRDVTDRRSLYRLLWTHRPGEPVVLEVMRGTERHVITVASGNAEEFFA
jgi:S1-C subfamily serine protease